MAAAGPAFSDTARDAPRFAALAMDYDGTIASDGRVDDRTVDALRRARRAGLRLVLVTGRVLDELTDVFPDIRLFDRIVAENGALLIDPAGPSRLLCAARPPELVRWLVTEGIPLSLGRSIIATHEAHHDAFSRAIRDLRLDWHLILNKGSVMALPSGVTKATGLMAALAELDVGAARTVGIGDAENDVAFLQICGLAVAVGNALPAVKAIAHIVTESHSGAGTCELVARLIDG